MYRCVGPSISGSSAPHPKQRTVALIALLTWPPRTPAAMIEATQLDATGQPPVAVMTSPYGVWLAGLADTARGTYAVLAPNKHTAVIERNA